MLLSRYDSRWGNLSDFSWSSNIKSINILFSLFLAFCQHLCLKRIQKLDKVINLSSDINLTETYERFIQCCLQVHFVHFLEEVYYVWVNKANELLQAWIICIYWFANKLNFLSISVYVCVCKTVRVYNQKPVKSAYEIFAYSLSLGYQRSLSWSFCQGFPLCGLRVIFQLCSSSWSMQLSMKPSCNLLGIEVHDAFGMWST